MMAPKKHKLVLINARKNTLARETIPSSAMTLTDARIVQAQVISDLAALEAAEKRDMTSGGKRLDR